MDAWIVPDSHMPAFLPCCLCVPLHVRFTPHTLQSMFSCINDRLSAQDQDGEVKEATILSMAALLALMGDVLQAEVPGVMKLLLERLRNDITRLPAVKAFARLAHSPLELGLGDCLDAVMVRVWQSGARSACPLLPRSTPLSQTVG